MEEPNMTDEKIASELKGNTLRVYWELLRSEDRLVGVREVQRALGFSSPALASYHLNKLVELGLVEKERGEYRLIKEVKVGVLRQFIRFRTVMFPRHIFYATMFTTLLVFYISRLEQVNLNSLFALVFGVLGTAISWYETLITWRQKP